MPFLKRVTQTAFLSVVFMFAGATESDQTTDIIQLIEQMNEVDFPQNMQCEGSCFFNFFSGGGSDRLVHQCMVDICGPPDKNPRFMLSNTSFSKSIDPAILTQFDEEVAPALRASLDRGREHYKKALEDLEDLKTALNQDPTHPDWGEIARTIILNNSTFATSEKGTPIRKAYKHKKKDLDPKKSAFIHAYLQRENALREQIADKVRNQSLDQLRESVRNQIHANMKDFEKSMDSSLPKPMEVRYLEMGKKIVESSNRPQIEKMAIGLSTEAEMKSIGCQDEVCRQQIRQEMDLFKKIIEQMAETTKEKYDEIVFNRCKSNFIERASALEHTRTFKDNLPKYKEKIINTGFASYSPESRQQFENYMDGTLQIDVPNNADTVKAFRDYLPPASPKDQTGQTVSFRDLERVVLGDPIYTNICPLSQLTNTSDVFWRDRHQIELSFVSCALHDHGKGILAHEIGHAISLLFHEENKGKMSEFSSKQYQKLRACATKQYKGKTFNPETQKFYHDHQDDRLKTEENTADLFSYMVFQDDPTHYKCVLLQTSRDGSKYKGLDVLSSPQQIVPHSTPVFRVLMEAIHKRTKLSSACRRVMDKYKNKINFKPCF